MLSSRSGHALRRLCRCWTRDISVGAPACTPRQVRTAREPNLLPANPLRPMEKTQILGSQLESQSTQLKPTHTSGLPLETVLDLTSSGVDQKLVPEGSDEAKTLYAAVSTASPDALLQLVSTQHRRLNKLHYALAMKRLFRFANELEKDEREHFKTELRQQKGFQVLCALVALKGQHYEGPVAADMLRFMCILGLDSDHPAVQVYLQLIKHHLNDLHLDVLVRLSYSLSELTVTSQTELLNKAIAVLCNLRVRQVATLNTWQQVTLLEQCGGALEEAALLALLKALEENLPDVSPRLAMATLRGLSAAGPSALAQPSVSKVAVGVVTDLTDRLHHALPTLPVSDLLSALTSLGELGVYDLDFLNDIAGRFTTDTDCTATDLLRILTHFGAYSHQHAGLVERFKLRLGTEDLAGWGQEEVVRALRVLAETSRPVEVLDPCSRPDGERRVIEDLRDRLVQFGSQLTTEEQQELTLDLAVLSDTSSSLDQVLSTENSQSSDGLLTSQKITSLLHLYKRNLNESYENHQGNVRELGKALSLAVDHCQPIEPSQDSQVSPLIDFVILVDSNGSPLPRKDSNLHNLPSGTQSVAVVVLHDNSFHSNTGQLRGRGLLCGRLLQREGFLALFINQDEWRRVEEEDMVPYLYRRVKNAPQDQHLHMLPLL